MIDPIINEIIINIIKFIFLLNKFININGPIFWIVNNIKIHIQFIDSIMMGIQKWKGAILNLINNAISII